MDTTQITLLHMEAMGTSGLPGTATARGERARSMEHQQVGAWAMAPVEDSGAVAGSAGEVLQQSGSAESGRMIRSSCHRTAVYVTRPHGGEGGGGREAFSYPD